MKYILPSTNGSPVPIDVTTGKTISGEAFNSVETKDFRISWNLEKFPFKSIEARSSVCTQSRETVWMSRITTIKIFALTLSATRESFAKTIENSPENTPGKYVLHMMYPDMKLGSRLSCGSKS
jgi:hypothetical protein